MWERGRVRGREGGRGDEWYRGPGERMSGRKNVGGGLCERERGREDEWYREGGGGGEDANTCISTLIHVVH